MLKGDLTDLYDRARDEAAFNAERQKQFVHDTGMKDSPDATNSSVILGADGATRSKAEIAKAEEKRQKDAVDTQMLLSSLRQDLQNQLNDLNQRLGDISEMRAGIEDVFANGYDLGEDGRISNEQAEKALREYEERTGQTVDRENEGAVMAALHEQWNEFDRETEEINHKATRIQSFMDNELAGAERLEREGKLPDVQRDNVLNQGASLVGEGKKLLEQTENQVDNGYQAELNQNTAAIKSNANALMMGL